MSIHSNPFPYSGVEHCESVFTADRVVRAAVETDGPAVLGADFDGMLNEGDDSDFMLRIGVGVGKVRKPLAALWGRMSRKAKARFLLGQLVDGLSYLRTCLTTVEDELDGYEDLKQRFIDFCVGEPLFRKIFEEGDPG